MSVRKLRHDRSMWVVFKIPGFVCKRFLPFFPTPPRSFTCATFLAVFDSRSSFFSPKPYRNACYAGYQIYLCMYLFYTRSLVNKANIITKDLPIKVSRDVGGWFCLLISVLRKVQIMTFLWLVFRSTRCGPRLTYCLRARRRWQNGEHRK